MRSVIFTAAVAAVVLARSILALPSPMVVQWSAHTYGPDGPWYAVKVEIGSANNKTIDLLPGGSWMSNVLSKDICTNASCDFINSGFYDWENSATQFEIGQTGDMVDVPFTATGSLRQVRRGSARWMFDNLALPVTEGGHGDAIKINLQNFDMLVVSNGFRNLPDGTEYPLTIGKLALGAPEVNQSWNFPQADSGRWNGTLLSSDLWTKGRTPSNSYSMHVGSPSMGILPSLVFGGYHQSRIVGKVSSQPYTIDTLPIDLLDIGIGVAEGASPFNFSSKVGLLAEKDSAFKGATQVNVDATLPFLYLPSTVCQSLAENLPITFQKKYGLYFWNSEDPITEKIINSPAYLEFTFRDSNSISANMTVRLPFSLLNMTLTQPMIDKPTAYFPCFHGKDPMENWTLGRAFLQGAFVSVKWEEIGGRKDANWFLAQAPGPNTPKTVAPKALNADDSELQAGNTDWKESWKGFWNVLAEDGSVETNATSTFNAAIEGPAKTGTSSTDASMPEKEVGASGLGTGPLVGIIVGAVAVLALFGLGFFLTRRRKKAKAVDTYGPTLVDVVPLGPDEKHPQQYSRAEMDGKALSPHTVQQNGGFQHSGQRRHKMGGQESVPVELYGSTYYARN